MVVNKYVSVQNLKGHPTNSHSLPIFSCSLASGFWNLIFPLVYFAVFAFSRKFYSWNHTICRLFSTFSLSYDNLSSDSILKFLSHFSEFEKKFLSFYCCICPGGKIVQIICFLIHWKVSWLLLSFEIINEADINIDIQHFVWMRVY